MDGAGGFVLAARERERGRVVVRRVQHAAGRTNFAMLRNTTGPSERVEQRQLPGCNKNILRTFGACGFIFLVIVVLHSRCGIYEYIPRRKLEKEIGAQSFFDGYFHLMLLPVICPKSYQHKNPIIISITQNDLIQLQRPVCSSKT